MKFTNGQSLNVKRCVCMTYVKYNCFVAASLLWQGRGRCGPHNGVPRPGQRLHTVSSVCKGYRVATGQPQRVANVDIGYELCVGEQTLTSRDFVWEARCGSEVELGQKLPDPGLPLFSRPIQAPERD